MAINIGDYPEELKKMMAQMQMRGSAGSQQGYDSMGVGRGSGSGPSMQNVIGGQTQQSDRMGGQKEDYANALKASEDSNLNRFLYGLDEYGEGLPGGFEEGMALEEFGQLSMENMGGFSPKGMQPGNFFDDPFAL
jgi:hypothetical protein